MTAKNNTVFVSAEPQIEEPPGTASFVLSVLGRLGISGWEVSIFYCGDNYIRQLNKQYRGKDEPTDVLSFGSAENKEQAAGSADFSFRHSPASKIIAGDIVISLDSLKKNCVEFGAAPNEELKRLLVHGVLHLKGCDHEGTLGGGDEMLVLQENILQKFEKSIIFEGDDGSV